MLTFDTTGLGSALHGLSEVVALTPAAGAQQLAIHLTDPANTTTPGGNRLLGPGGV